jgi:hypothetical protein
MPGSYTIGRGCIARLHLAPLPGRPQKRVLFQLARGDQAIPNPTSSALLRAAVPTLPADPHAFEENFGSEPAQAIATAVNVQAAGFLALGERCASGDPCIPEVNDLVRPVFGTDLFVILDQLPEDLGVVEP